MKEAEVDKRIGIRSVHYPQNIVSPQAPPTVVHSIALHRKRREKLLLTATQSYLRRHQRAPCSNIPLRNRYRNLRDPNSDNDGDGDARKKREPENIGARARGADVGKGDRRHSSSLRCLMVCLRSYLLYCSFLTLLFIDF